MQANSSVQSELTTESLIPRVEEQAGGEVDNRRRLGELYQSQSNARANEIVNSEDANFSDNITFQQGSFTGGNAGWVYGGKVGAGVNSDAGLVGDIAVDESKVQAPGRQAGANQMSGQGQGGQAANPSIAQFTSPDDESFKVHVGGRIAAEPAKEPEIHESGGGEPPGTQVQRYVRQLEEKDKQRGAADYSINGGGIEFMDERGGRKTAAEPIMTVAKPDHDRESIAFATPRSARLPERAGPAVLASLEVELHPRGKKYLFSTPRGDAEIAALAVSDPLLGRVFNLAALAAVILAVWAVVIVVRHRYARHKTARRAPQLRGGTI